MKNALFGLWLAVGCGDDATLSDAGPSSADGGSTRDGGSIRDGSIADAGAGDPELLRWDDFEFAGAFRLPADRFGSSELNFSQGPIEVGATGESLFVVGHAHQQEIAEFPIPALLVSERLTELEMAGPPIQTFASVLDRVSNPQSIDTITALELAGDALVVSAIEYYDAPADNSHTTLVARDAGDLAGSAVDGFFSLEGGAHAAGWISDVPAEWQAALGATSVAGASSGMPIISRLSVGPSAFVFDRGAIAGAGSTPGPVSTRALLDYDLEHPLHDDLMNDGGDNDLWTHLSRAVYGFIVPGSRTYATIGHSGGHAETGVCYKCVPMGETAECGGYCSIDPGDYSLYYWFYDVADLVAVQEGRMEPHAVRPYEHGPFTAPFGRREIGGGAYDAARGLLYLSMQRADDEQGEYANPPVIVAFRIRAPS
jgi:hypothetical protein